MFHLSQNIINKVSTTFEKVNFMTFHNLKNKISWPSKYILMFKRNNLNELKKIVVNSKFFLENGEFQ